MNLKNNFQLFFFRNLIITSGTESSLIAIYLAQEPRQEPKKLFTVYFRS